MIRRTALLSLLLLLPVSADIVWLGTSGRRSEGIYVSDLDPEKGTLSEPRLAVELQGAGFQALSPDGKFIYSTCGISGGGGAAALKVKDGGMLELINQQSTGGKGCCFVGIDATGRCVLAANYGDGSVASFHVADDGSLEKAVSVHRHEGSGPNERRQKAPHAHSFYPGPDNKFAYAPDLGIDKVLIYKMDPASGKTETAGAGMTPPGSGPRHMKFGKDGRHAYVLNELTLTVSVFERDAKTGALNPGPVVPVLPADVDTEGMTCSEIRISKDGKFAYTANRDTAGKGRDSVSVLLIGSDGGLKRLQTVPAGIEIPRNIGLDPSGRWLLVCGQKSGRVVVIKVDPKSGKMSATGHGVDLGAPMCVTFAK
jgi:6-phosphogluconolactonase